MSTSGSGAETPAPAPAPASAPSPSPSPSPPPPPPSAVTEEAANAAAPASAAAAVEDAPAIAAEEQQQQLVLPPMQPTPLKRPHSPPPPLSPAASAVPQAPQQWHTPGTPQPAAKKRRLSTNPFTAEFVAPAQTGAAAAAAGQYRLQQLALQQLALQQQALQQQQQARHRHHHPTSAPGTPTALLPQSPAAANLPFAMQLPSPFTPKIEKDILTYLTPQQLQPQPQPQPQHQQVQQYSLQQDGADVPADLYSALQMLCTCLPALLSELSSRKASGTTVAAGSPAYAPSSSPLLSPAAALPMFTAPAAPLLPALPAIAAVPQAPPPASRPQAQSQAQAQPWGVLYSQTASTRDCVLTGPIVTFGRSSKATVVIRDTTLSSNAARMYNKENGLVLECTCSNGMVSVDGRHLPKGTCTYLHSGSEVSFFGLKPTSFIVQLNPQVAPPRPGPPQPATTASPQHCVPLPLPASFVPTSTPAVHYTLPGTPAQHRPQHMAVDDTPPILEDRLTSLQSRLLSPLASELCRLLDPSNFSSAAPPATASPPPPPPPVIAAPLALSAPASAEAAPPPSAQQLYAAVTTRVEAWGDLKVTLEAFPYWLGDDVRSALQGTGYIFLRRPEYARYVQDISCVSRRVLLSGPPGTEVYQETLARALARHFKSSFLLVDGPLLEPPPPPSSSSFSSSTVTALPPSVLSAARREMSLGLMPLLRGLADIVSDDEDDADESQRPPPPPPAEAGDDAAMVAVTTVDTATGGDMEPLSAKPQRRRFKKEDRVRYMGPSRQSIATMHERLRFMDPALFRGPQAGSRGRVVVAFEEAGTPPRKVGVEFDRPVPGGLSLLGQCHEGRGYFVDSTSLILEDDTQDESNSVEIVFRVAREHAPCVVFVRGAEREMLSSSARYAAFKRELTRLERGPATSVLVIGSTVSPASSDTATKERKRPPLLLSKSGHGATAVLDFSFIDQLAHGVGLSPSSSCGCDELGGPGGRKMKLLSRLLPNHVSVTAPSGAKDAPAASRWHEQIEHDAAGVRAAANKQHITRTLSRCSVTCDVEQVPADCLDKQLLNGDQVDKVVGTAIATHLQLADEQVAAATPAPATATAEQQMMIAPSAVESSVRALLAAEPDPRRRALLEVEPENEFEKRLLAEVIPPDEVSVSFDDVGALDDVKETLRELVMLPLQRPELFRKGNLTKPCKGILLFGPPGTGKTMLAKAVATESGANFLNVTMSSIASKWFGEGEKYVRAVFTLASKIAPAVIFVDEVDSVLGRRDAHGAEHEAMRKIKNEFMSSWDGLRTRGTERVLVLAATNRPFDLDDAVLRRLNRRLLVDLPSTENRLKILHVILQGEDLEPGFDMAALAAMAEGFSGSDLKNLCVMTAFQPIRELIRKEKEEAAAGDAKKVAAAATPELRPLTMRDFEQTLKEVAGSSVHEDAFSLAELRKWNEMYGDTGSRHKQTLSYFL
eukprot:TRINITY_DN443_c0_g1_i2.p1 TRINITY_DN443_c0_g1~~TRINITY_DN443_c0_g1_i2.p1  ORF type:complete len:1454 (-),score=393.61 TRINITY_DN443_c0_g1_i2:167-4528(-)